MKNLFYSLILATNLFAVSIVHAEPETKKVCVMQKDAKTGKEKEVCKNVKIHKKLEGTKVPEKK
jgi:hypothetical protein